ncbi:class I SAM-dependent methyltransferase [Gloeocapsa sp. PCC 73106]|uniref:class I SAM-dependent methyltransferase n=1 Tax=Gloeocapsa sp. PCC 73106 TaxID=102232 RepID=UPI0002ACD623|nr:class I SAM-dependent methyltransferase [Gloeocapsa sp. PCC 73106]ELR96904.1 methylase involved in ubiquinone/menaquinone biosynthesis [Gloeocapsa sp. PCC 73106]
MNNVTSNAKVFELEETVKSWDNDYYQPVAEYYYDQAIPTMLKLMGVQPGSKVLDAGCGPGVHSIRIAKQNCQVMAIDFSKTMLQNAKQRVEKAGFSTAVEFQQEDLTALSFPDASFQYVFSWGVIIHIQEIEKALNELTRIVDTNGKLALYVTNNNALDHLVEKIAKFCLRQPILRKQKLSIGEGTWYDFNGEKLWVWQFDTNFLTQYIEARGFRKTHHIIGEFTENQRRVQGIFRKFLLQLNNFCYALKVHPSIASTNLLIFEKLDVK